MPRVLSLLPSATEIVWALDMAKSLVGRSHECDFPSTLKHLPVVTSPLIDVSKSSGEIHATVQNQIRHGLSIYKVDSDLIQSLKPELILTQAHCGVCAVSKSEIENILGTASGARPHVLSLSPNNLSEVWRSFQNVADALGVSDRGREKLDIYRRKMDTIKNRAARCEPKPTVAMIEWIDPLMAAGNWVPEMVGLAGGRNLFGKAGEHSSWMKYEDLLKANPDVICFLPCGFNIARSRDELEKFAMRPGWFDLIAVRTNRVYLLDGNHYFNRPGPRLVDSLEMMAEILHPEEFDFGRQNDGWEYWGFDRF